MTTHHITGHKTATYDLQKDGATYVLDRNSSIKLPGDYAIFQQATLHDDRLVIKGSVMAGQQFLNAGVFMGGSDSTVVIAASGVVRGGAAVELAGLGDDIRNFGRLLGGGYGILADRDNHIDNSGVIKGSFAISTHSFDVTVINHAGGKIIGSADAMVMAGDTATHHTILNHGLMQGGNNALYGYDSNSTITNRGVMKGAILLGGGDDSFDNRGGKIDHDVEGQAGNDTLIVDRSSTRLVELAGGGIDKVESTVSYTLAANVENLTLLGKGDTNGKGNAEVNRIDGNSGDNKLMGLAGADTLNGAAGDDIMTGGADADIFMFGKGYGHDTITDFNHAQDHVDLSGQTAILDFDDMMANHVTSSHGDLKIHIGSATLTLENTSASELDFKDFFF